MAFRTDFGKETAEIHRQAVSTLFSLFEEHCEGAIAVDKDARVVWINEKYRKLLGLDLDQPVVGREVEEIIPNSMLRQVIEVGEPILLDIMRFGAERFVVTRLPIKDGGQVTGAVGFVLYDKPAFLKPLVTKFEKLESDLARAHRELDAQRRAKYTLSQFVGTNGAALEVKRLARRAAQLDTTVLLIGETGTGKELVAQAIHAASSRVNEPFVGVNMAAVPEALMEAEFFGAAPGAYTGADRKGRDGKFKLADKGTLFLDEVCEMPINIQAKLLRALQEREIEPLGGNRIIRVDARVIAATTKDLKALVDEGKFRSDLYFRLNVLPITLTPLRDKISDLEPLVEVMLEQIALRTGTPQKVVDASGLAELAAYDWPGNVRELRNVLERVSVLIDRRTLGADDFAGLLPESKTFGRSEKADASRPRPLAAAVAELERDSIRSALKITNGKKAPAAKLLGISRSKLYEKLSEYGLMSGNQS